MGAETWLEKWQGVAAEGCGAPVAPHNGSSALYTYDTEAGKLTVAGNGAFFGLAKIHNGGEDANPTDGTIVYDVTTLNWGYLAVDINVANNNLPAGFWWRYAFQRIPA